MTRMRKHKNMIKSDQTLDKHNQSFYRYQAVAIKRIILLTTSLVNDTSLGWTTATLFSIRHRNRSPIY